MTRYIFTLAAALLLTSSAQARQAAGELQIQLDKPLKVQVDGVEVPLDAKRVARVEGLAKGAHQVVINAPTGRRPLAKATVELGDGEAARCAYVASTHSLDCATVVAAGATTTAQGTTVSTGGVSVSAAAGAGVQVVTGGVTVQTGSTTTAAGGVAVVGAGALPPPPPQAMPLPDHVDLVVRVTDGSWNDVLVDGKVELELRNSHEGTVRMSPGLHTIAVRSFMADSPYDSGRIETGYATRITIGLAEGEPVTFYDGYGWSGSNPGAAAPMSPPTGVSPSAPPPQQVKLVIRSTDGEWADVRVDGKVELQLRSGTEGVIWVTSGVHTVEIVEFMEDTPYARGRLDTGLASTITLGITEDQNPVCYDHKGWSPQ